MTPRTLDPATVREKLQLLEELLGALGEVGDVSEDRLRADVVIRLAVERVLTQSVDLVVSVCSHVASAELQRVPTTYRAAITDAAAAGVIGDDLARSLVAAVGMRNVLVHEYARVDLALVAAAVPVAGADLTAFIRQVASWLTART